MVQNIQPKKLKTYCPTCARRTNHEVMYEHSEHYTPDNAPEMGIDFADGTWQIVRCMGCEGVSFREYWFTSEDVHPLDGPEEGTEYRYPKVGSDDLSEERFTLLPEKIRRHYREIIETYNQGLFTACTGLIRSIIEGIANEYAESANLPDVTEVPKGRGGIEWKGSKLVDHEVLSKSHGDILHESRVLGNRAVHELEAPPPKELKELIKIIEHTMYVVFEISEKLDEMKWKREHREKMRKKKKE